MSNENNAGIDLDSERAKFEVWASEKGIQLTLDVNHEGYHYPLAKASWGAWQAARRASTTPSSKDAGGVAAALPGDWTAEWDAYSAPGTIRLHSPRWGGAFLGEPKPGNIALPAIVYRLLADILASAAGAGSEQQGAEVDERTRFEAAYIARIKERDPLRKYGEEDIAMYLARNGNNENRYLHAQEAWEGWQARAALARAPLPGQDNGQAVDDARDAARLEKFIDWYLRDGKRFEVHPWGHVEKTTREHILRWLDSPGAAMSASRPDDKGEQSK